MNNQRAQNKLAIYKQTTKKLLSVQKQLKSLQVHQAVWIIITTVQ